MEGLTSSAGQNSCTQLLEERLMHVRANLDCIEVAIAIHMQEYSGTSLLWTPWGPSKVSCIERCPHFRGYKKKHSWDIEKCP